MGNLQMQTKSAFLGVRVFVGAFHTALLCVCRWNTHQHMHTCLAITAPSHHCTGLVVGVKDEPC